MCNDFPKHDDIDIVEAKIWLIGRAYSATLERRVGPKFNLNKSLQHLKRNDSKLLYNIDDRIDEIRKITKLTENSDIEKVLTTHKYLIDFFTKLIENPDRPDIPIPIPQKRSLASKYLHFHAPNAFFIYDSIVNQRLRTITRTSRSPIIITTEQFGDIDNEYTSHVLRCINFRDNILLNNNITPRQIDYLLYGGY